MMSWRAFLLNFFVRSLGCGKKNFAAFHEVATQSVVLSQGSKDEFSKSNHMCSKLWQKFGNKTFKALEQDISNHDNDFFAWLSSWKSFLTESTQLFDQSSYLYAHLLTNDFWKRKDLFGKFLFRRFRQKLSQKTTKLRAAFSYYHGFLPLVLQWEQLRSLQSC